MRILTVLLGLAECPRIQATTRLRAVSAGGVIVVSPARSEAECRDMEMKLKSPEGTIERRAPRAVRRSAN